MRQTEGAQLQLLLRQWAERADRTGCPSPGRFLSGEELSLARHQANESGLIACFSGGWEEADRVQVCFCQPGDDPEFTFQWIEIRWNARFGGVTHSDLFGSLMAIGLDRMYFGDLICQEDRAYLCALPEAVRQLPDAWIKAGNVPIRLTVLDEAPAIRPPQGTPLRDTVPSPRLDCILASGLRQSRAKAADMIRAGLVSVDHEPETRGDRQLHAGQLLSVRHFGRIRIDEIGSPTRKERLPIQLSLFTRK